MLIALDGRSAKVSKLKLAGSASVAEADTLPTPSRFPPVIDESVLLVQTPGDPLVPDSQGEALARVRPETRLLSLEPGDVPWIHGTSVSRASFRRYLQEEKAFLARAAAGR